MTSPTCFVGVDVSKDRLDVTLLPQEKRWNGSNAPDGIAALLEWLRPFRGALVVLEATGGYEHAVAVALSGAGFYVAIVNPRQARDFAKATGRQAKTDSIDADGLALFAERVRPEPRALPDEHQRFLQATQPRPASLL